MINLLPTDLKTERIYARRNARLARYLWLEAIMILALGGAFAAAHLYLANQTRAAEAQVGQKNQTIASFRDVETKAKILSAQLDTINAIDSSQTKFSLLLVDLARTTPRGTAITNLALTGDDKKPVRISATADNFNAAVSLRQALATSPRISAVDIESLTAAPDQGYKVELSVGFKPGQAK
ncbi:MAG TPA: PilN domain-containing protein [Candidatus Saccharimonadales bacterium]|nr:PilN domain-containing protein [Candidatus Saccharimonadales bacterium]